MAKGRNRERNSEGRFTPAPKASPNPSPQLQRFKRQLNIGSTILLATVATLVAAQVYSYRNTVASATTVDTSSERLGVVREVQSQLLDVTRSLQQYAIAPTPKSIQQYEREKSEVYKAFTELRRQSAFPPDVAQVNLLYKNAQAMIKNNDRFIAEAEAVGLEEAINLAIAPARLEESSGITDDLNGAFSVIAQAQRERLAASNELLRSSLILGSGFAAISLLIQVAVVIYGRMLLIHQYELRIKAESGLLANIDKLLAESTERKDEADDKLSANIKELRGLNGGE